MPNAVCPNCGSSSFACEQRNIKNVNIPVGFIYCTTCFAAIGTFDAVLHNMLPELHKFSKLAATIENTVMYNNDGILLQPNIAAITGKSDY